VKPTDRDDEWALQDEGEPPEERPQRESREARGWEQLSMVDEPPAPARESTASTKPATKPRGAKREAPAGNQPAAALGRGEEMGKAASPISEEISLEAALTRLEAIVRELEAGNIDLDRSLALFEEGVGLSRLDSKRLTESEVKITKLVRTLEGGFATEPFDAGEGNDGGKERG
jgi:exodeoxyribonuclease VII small subunit